MGLHRGSGQWAVGRGRRGVGSGQWGVGRGTGLEKLNGSWAGKAQGELAGRAEWELGSRAINGEYAAEVFRPGADRGTAGGVSHRFWQLAVGRLQFGNYSAVAFRPEAEIGTAGDVSHRSAAADSALSEILAANGS